jgi:hypothetical protein
MARMLKMLVDPVCNFSRLRAQARAGQAALTWEQLEARVSAIAQP